jgi:hypothetical protein
MTDFKRNQINKYEQLRQYIKDTKSTLIKEDLLYDYEILDKDVILKKEKLYNYVIRDNQLTRINLYDSGTDSYFVKISYKNTQDYWTQSNLILVQNIDGKDKHSRAEYLVMKILKELNVEFEIISVTYI